MLFLETVFSGRSPGSPPLLTDCPTARVSPVPATAGVDVGTAQAPGSGRVGRPAATGKAGPTSSRPKPRLATHHHLQTTLGRGLGHAAAVPRLEAPAAAEVPRPDQPDLSRVNPAHSVGRVEVHGRPGVAQLVRFLVLLHPLHVAILTQQPLIANFAAIFANSVVEDDLDRLGDVLNLVTENVTNVIVPEKVHNPANIFVLQNEVSLGGVQRQVVDEPVANHLEAGGGRRYTALCYVSA